MRHVTRAAGPLAALLLAGCYPGPVDPVVVTPPPPFERLPYVQNVSDSAATILWKATGPAGGDTVYVRSVAPDPESGEVPAGASRAWRAVPADSVARGIRRARLEALAPAAPYEYRVSPGGGDLGPWRFRTAPAPGMALDPGRTAGGGDTVRVLLFGDSGWGSDGQLALARLMNRREWDLAIHVGDVAYEDGTERDFTLRHFLVYGDLLAGVPFFPAVGNHDLHVEDGRPYDLAFEWPAPLPGVRWYSFRWGPILFVALDTSSPTDDVAGLRRGRGRQYEWLEATLAAAADDGTIRWTVVFLHHPLISHAVGLSGHGPDGRLLRTLGPLFERTGVDLVAAGHDHHYERTYPVRNGRRVQPGCGYSHVLQGAGGASMHARAVRDAPIVAAGARRYSFTELRITPDRLLGRTIAADGSVIDEFRLVPFAGTEDPRCAG
ncbi:MAG: metallophosphoesterase [Gemmatimonadota bacterium]|nr:metallophosphoesterase [Gemmatimonadota bacterium]